jgi:hypothetical protein
MITAIAISTFLSTIVLIQIKLCLLFVIISFLK